jgi:hypothetical protein
MISWVANLRMPNYTQVVAFPACIMEVDDLDIFESFMMDEIGAKHPPVVIGCVETQETSHGPGGRSDFMFLIHDEDASDYTFCTKRLRYGLRWLEDVRGNDPRIYPRDFCTAYPLTW